jgi:molybdopterin-guanine dinucleotide biosynthesis protein B
MKAFAVVGPSGSGKTTFIIRLIPELESRGARVAVLKHCHEDVLFDKEGKDSWKFTEAGAFRVGIVTPSRVAVFEETGRPDDIEGAVGRFFADADIVLVEGGKGVRGLKKISLLRKDIAERMEFVPEELLAVVSDDEVESAIPVFRFSEVDKIADLVMSSSGRSPEATLVVDGAEIPLNPFVESFIRNTVMGMVASLRGTNLNPGDVVLHISSKGPQK